MEKLFCTALIAFAITIFGCGGGSNGTSAIGQAKLNVVSITPLNGTNDVPRDGDITVLFSEQLNANTVNINTFNIKDEQNYPVDAESITVNGNKVTFKPKTKLCATRKYTVTITSTIKSINGSAMSGNYTSSFTTQSSQWSTPEIFSQATVAKTVMDNRGNIIIVWWKYNNSNGNYEIVMSQMNGGSWSNPKVISGNATNVYNPNIAMDNNGNAIIVWEDWGPGRGIVMTEYRNGIWTDPQVITVAGLEYTAFASPSVAMNDKGKAIIVWSQTDIYKIEYTNGAWSPPIAVSSGGYCGYPRVAINNKGNAIITWRDNASYSPYVKLLSREYQNGIWNAPKIVSVAEKDPDALYQLSFDSNGNAIIVWEQMEGLSLRTYRNEYRNGNWIGPVAVSPAGVAVLYPKIAMDNNGNAIMAWQQVVNNTWQVFISELRADTWNAPRQVSPNGAPAEFPFVKMDNSGNAILLWNQANGADMRVYRMQYINGVWTDNYLLAISQDQLNFVPYDIAMDGTGDAYMVWSQADGSTWQLYRNHYH